MNSAPLSYLDSAGPAATPIVELAWGLGGISTAVVAIVGVALILAIWRRRPSVADDTLLEAVGRPGAGLAWIYIGLSISVLVLAACTVWSLVVLGAVMHPSQIPQLTLQVTAHQWWWEVRYLGANPGRTFTTANEIVIPAGQPVQIQLSSTDVIHSFWVPKLAGKIDVIPGVTNATWMQASAPGVFRGQCGEYCGLQHARMAFYVIAKSAPDFTAWLDQQLALPTASSSPTADVGQKTFLDRCASCHTIRGTPAGGIVGPDLSHMASRKTLAAGLIPNDAENLSAWIADPQAVKPGALMPTVPLKNSERAAIVSYLRSLN